MRARMRRSQQLLQRFTVPAQVCKIAAQAWLTARALLSSRLPRGALHVRGEKWQGMMQAVR